MMLRSAPAGWRQVTVELQPTGLPDTPWNLHVHCDEGNNFDFTVDELHFIGAAIISLTDQTEKSQQGEMAQRLRLSAQRKAEQ